MYTRSAERIQRPGHRSDSSSSSSGNMDRKQHIFVVTLVNETLAIAATSRLVDIVCKLRRVEAVVVQAHAQVGELHVVPVRVRPQFVQELLQLYSIADKEAQAQVEVKIKIRKCRND